MDRRQLLSGLGALGLSARSWADAPASTVRNVVLVRFGGGVRRRESIAPDTSWSRYLLHELLPQGTLFDAMDMGTGREIQTSHGQGTLFLLTGRYYDYAREQGRPGGEEHYRSPFPTLLELVRASGAAEHEVIVLNGENRPQEEHFTFSQHPDFGPAFRASLLSRRGFDAWRASGSRTDTPVDAFWAAWQAYWGDAPDAGTLHPRGDRLLTELALWSLRVLKPRFLMINYNDCDYVHWGNPEHYRRGVAIMDHGLRQIVEALDRDPSYRDDTLLVVAPDCGRDDNRLVSLPFQHHFGDRSSREVFAFFRGPGIPRGVRIDRPTQQVDVMPTIAAQLGLPRAEAEGRALEEVWG
ncbi:MAG: hypothetical protein R3F61_27940 [Myxococcota bacterium]